MSIGTQNINNIQNIKTPRKIDEIILIKFLISVIIFIINLLLLLLKIDLTF